MKKSFNHRYPPPGKWLAALLAKQSIRLYSNGPLGASQGVVTTRRSAMPFPTSHEKALPLHWAASPALTPGKSPDPDPQ